MISEITGFGYLYEIPDLLSDKIVPIVVQRNYNRAISLPERYSKEKSDLLPKATKKLICYLLIIALRRKFERKYTR